MVAVCGIMVSISDGPNLLIAYTALLALKIIIRIVSIGCCVLLLFDIRSGFLSAHAVHEELFTYSSASSVQHRWDTMQRELTCCGGYGLHGNQNVMHDPIGQSNNSVPDSCCHSETVGCGKDVLLMNDIETVLEKIYVHGC